MSIESRTPTQMELLLVYAAGGEVRIKAANVINPTRLTWESVTEPNGDLVFRVKKVTIIEGEVTPADPWKGL